MTEKLKQKYKEFKKRILDKATIAKWIMDDKIMRKKQKNTVMKIYDRL